MRPYKALIVDDEQYALDGIVHGIDWAHMGVTEVMTALDAHEAQALLRLSPIDIIVCDIEMPKVSGLDLLDWVNVNSPETVTVFLTGHADFSYAKTAIQLGSFDYLLKPVDYKELTKVIRRMLGQISKRREEEQAGLVYQRYYKLFQSHKPLLEEKFWQDLLSRRFSPSTQAIEELICSYELGFTAKSLVLPVLLSIEQWQKDLSARDEDIMEYAMRNIASELIQQDLAGAVIQDRGGNNWALIYGESQSHQLIDPSELISRCEHFIAMCNLYLSCHVSCYIGEATEFSMLLEKHVQLLEEERLNVTRTNTVKLITARREPSSQRLSIPWVSEVSVLFDLGNKADIEFRLDDIFRGLEVEEELSVETLRSFYHALVHMLFQVFHKRGLSLHDVLEAHDLDNIHSATRSLSQFRAWCRRIVQTALDYLLHIDSDKLSIKQKITDYINEHLAEEISRQHMAEFVHFNPAYLSRLFKKEVGASLSDYILAKRIERAKQLLASTRMKISDISATIGYDNISYFNRKFKKITGVTPQEYRKNP